MSKDLMMVKQIDFIIAVRRIKVLGIAILVGVIAIYVFGLFVAGNNFIENFEIINLATLLFLVFMIALGIFIKNMIMKKVTLSGILTTYFNAHIIPFAIIDFGALFCITTNLFVNGNILYATIGMAMSVAAIIMIFPREEDFEIIKTRS
ncbi:MAG: hypothetical protein ABIY50_08180 [Ignavibacteria bacterium]